MARPGGCTEKDIGVNYRPGPVKGRVDKVLGGSKLEGTSNEIEVWQLTGTLPGLTDAPSSLFRYHRGNLKGCCM